MALINCVECGKQISSFAESCPHCGCPARLQNEAVNTNILKTSNNKCEDNLNVIRINGADYNLEEALAYIESKELIKAVKLLKDAAGLSLADAKSIVDTINQTGQIPKEVSFNRCINSSPKIEVSTVPEVIYCPACKNQVSNQAQSCPHCGQPINTKPRCPTCGSQDIKKITGTERGLSVWAWGAFSNKINKNWKCNKCGHTW